MSEEITKDVYEKIIKNQEGEVIYTENITVTVSDDGVFEQIEGFDLKSDLELHNQMENERLQRLLKDRDMTLKEFNAQTNKEITQLKEDRAYALAESKESFEKGFKVAQLRLETQRANQTLQLQSNQQAIQVAKMQLDASMRMSQLKMQATQALIGQTISLVSKSLSSLPQLQQVSIANDKE